MLERLHVRTVILDVEPLVCLWGTGSDELAAGLTAVAETVAAVPSVRAAAFVTNSRRLPRESLHDERLALSYLHRARKPWLRLGALRELPQPAVVVGDQPLTDGLLAWRLKVPFIQLALPERAPLGVRVQARIGAIVVRALFQFAPPEPSAS
jgi:hypothetical protein